MIEERSPEQIVGSKGKESLFAGKWLIVAAVLLAMLILFFIPFQGKSLLERITEVTKKEEENLLPNFGFEEGSGSQPEGWETKSGRVD